MSESQNVELMKAAYAAFDRGDIAALLEMNAPDVEWNWPAVKEIPQSGPRKGRAQVAQFFETLLAVEDPVSLERREFTAQGDRVVVLGSYTARAKATGRTWESEFVHVWTIRNGQIGRLDIQYNTAAAVDAYRAVAATERGVISGLRTEFVDAFNSEDVRRMAALLTDDHIGMPPNRPSALGVRESIEFWREGFSAATSRFVVTPQALEIAGPIAVDRFDWSADSTPRTGGAPIHDEGKCIWIWRREGDDGWRIARAIWNSNLAAAGLWSGAGVAR
jgi:ketosteroid isomerase-like protein